MTQQLSIVTPCHQAPLDISTETRGFGRDFEYEVPGEISCTAEGCGNAWLPDGTPVVREPVQW